MAVSMSMEFSTSSLTTDAGRSMTSPAAICAATWGVSCSMFMLFSVEVESVVVTMQDLTPLEELERLRAEFLGVVSHELRTPLVSIKQISADSYGPSVG